MQISKRTQYLFGEFATAYAVLRNIERAFIAEDFQPVPNYPTFDGARRGLVSAYFAAIDLSDPAQVGRLIRVLADAIDSWGRDPASGELVPDAKGLIRSLQRDGVPINDDGELTTSIVALNVPLSDFNRLGDPRVVQQHLERISANVDRDPPAAVGSCKELVESVCKFILQDYAIAFSPTDNLLDLYKKTAKELRLNREAVPGSAKGSEAAHRVLQNLSTTVQSLAELRNELGLGHGRTAPSPAFARHARLAFNSARAVVEFLLETWHERRRSESPAA
jgi:plasmid stabilization system protein ParE